MMDWSSFPARPLVMGIVNVTPDSFSDGGDHLDPAAAIHAGLDMAAAGADILDIGGESTRPGIDPTSEATEQARVIPVVRGLRDAGVPLSVDTRNAGTMAAALAAGVSIVNDVTGLAHDPEAAGVVASTGAAVILMHMRGTPQTMNRLAHYADVVADVAAELGRTVAHARAAGISPGRIMLDPGIGFAKMAEHNLPLLRGLPMLQRLGYPLLVGVSRKRFIGHLTGTTTPKERDAGSLAAGLFAVSRGARVLRVHDVPATVQALRVWHALAG